MCNPITITYNHASQKGNNNKKPTITTHRIWRDQIGTKTGQERTHRTKTQPRDRWDTKTGEARNRKTANSGESTSAARGDCCEVHRNQKFVSPKTTAGQDRDPDLDRGERIMEENRKIPPSLHL